MKTFLDQCADQRPQGNENIENFDSRSSLQAPKVVSLIYSFDFQRSISLMHLRGSLFASFLKFLLICTLPEFKLWGQWQK